MPKSISLIITTYNWPEALNLVLKSVTSQSILPNEVIIADDGSKGDTKKFIESFQTSFPVPLIHSWQEDTGFRLARSRNVAIAKASGDYIIMIDGDMILHKYFIRDHKRHAKKGYFSQGRRVILKQTLSKMLIDGKQKSISIFSSELKNKLNAVSIPLLSSFFTKLFSKKDHVSVRGCNMAYWKADIMKINGYNEAFIGWGREDSEFIVRLLRSDVKRQDLRCAGVAYHLYHKESPRDNLDKNDDLLENAIKAESYVCEQGINQHLKGEQN